ncbi:hypothetical protein QBK99_03260 [Corticibacterium sp. UT-5YL-CI-8]|nr:hypothetical protein [Tianweitania sp. UT-5YL-CI-8]
MIPSDARAAARLAALLDKPLPATQEDVGCEEFFSPWDAFDRIMSPYNGEIDQVAVWTLEAIRDGENFDLLNSKNGLFVEFFLHIMAGHAYVDYGTSPRGAFFTYGGTKELADQWISKWKEWYAVNWDEPFPAGDRR